MTQSRPSAQFKTHVDDFVVRERLAFEPAGEGSHRFLYVRKRGANTADVAARLARAARVRTMDVGYAGLKDKWAVTEQWFSVPDSGRFSEIEVGRFDADVEVLDARLHTHKLRRGQLTGNAFEICLRHASEAVVPSDALFPNYFGPQRMGGDNLKRATTWVLNRRRRRITPFKEGLYLSVLRSHLFNAVLAERERLGNWACAVTGDVADSCGLPTGPLWGRGRSETAGAALEVEQAALGRYAKVCEALEFAGVDQGRRSLAVQPSGFSAHQRQDGCLQLAFELPAGAYATVFLAQHFELLDMSVAA